MAKNAVVLDVAPEATKTLIQQGTIQHVAIIMDGNRRWAKERGKFGHEGHYHGYKALKRILEYCSGELQLPVLTVYAFSTENWRRSSGEVDVLLKLFHNTLKSELKSLMAWNIRLKFIGDLTGFPKAFQQLCHEAQERTVQNTGMLYQVALSYGGRAEITEATRRIAHQVKAGLLDPDTITEDLLKQNLYSGAIADPDMVIRTGGEYRLSNFLLWQLAYAEIFVTEELWPDFTPDVLNRTLEAYQTRQRRFGQ